MEHLLADNDGLVTSSALLNATTEMERKLSATAAQQFIKLLLKEKWLEQMVYATFIIFLYYLIAEYSSGWGGGGWLWEGRVLRVL